MFYAKGRYDLTRLENLTKKDWFELSMAVRSDIRLALNSSIPYVKGKEKVRLFELQSRLIDYSMGGK